MKNLVKVLVLTVFMGFVSCSDDTEIVEQNAELIEDSVELTEVTKEVPVEETATVTEYELSGKKKQATRTGVSSGSSNPNNDED